MRRPATTDFATTDFATTDFATTDFDSDLIALLSRLRRYALSLTRDRADDLVQGTTTKALAGRASYRPGTNLAAWLDRIERNAFISGLRCTRTGRAEATALRQWQPQYALAGFRPAVAGTELPMLRRHPGYASSENGSCFARGLPGAGNAHGA